MRAQGEGPAVGGGAGSSGASFRTTLPDQRARPGPQSLQRVRLLLAHAELAGERPSRAAQLLFMVMAELAAPPDRQCYARWQRLAAKCGRPVIDDAARRWVERARRELVNFGLVSLVAPAGPGRTATYAVNTTVPYIDGEDWPSDDEWDLDPREPWIRGLFGCDKDGSVTLLVE